ncbi:MAG: hypothetical protein ACRDJ5_02280 [Actinomycetota bacterium]
MAEREDVERLRTQAREDRKLFERAAQALAEIHRAEGLSDVHADVLTALRIRIEGKERATLEDLLTAAGDSQKDLGQVLEKGGTGGGDWPEIEEKKRDWPGA